MGATAAVHPTDPILQAYGLGKLADVSSDSVSKHLESCDSCRRRVAELSSDEFLGRLRRARVTPDQAASGWSPDAASSTEGTPSHVVPPARLDALPPELVDHPDYEIVRELGRGGMGVVYLANNRLMGRPEVLKVAGRHLIERTGVLDRFLREIRSAAMLHHANIVTAYTAMRLGQSVVLAMEYVEGLDLAKMVKTKGPLPVAHACNFIHQAALGLQHAHERGMVHRDIKPANLILARDGKKAIVKVLDFGLAKVTSEGQTDSGLTREGQMLGTPDYIAPEQIRNAQSADIRADIYSLGCTLYYLLTGGPPFRGDHLWDVYQAHFSMEAGPLNLVRPEVSVELAAVVAKMMAKEPGRRFQTPGEVARALAPFSKPAATQPPGSGIELPRVETQVAPQQPSTARPAPMQPTTLGTIPAPAGLRPTKTAPDGVSWESLIEIKADGPLYQAAKPRTAEPKPARAEEPVRRPPWFWPAIIAASMCSALALGVIIYVATDKGRVRIILEDRKAVVHVDGETIRIDSLDEQITLRAGEHTLRVKWGDGEFATRTFVVNRGDNEVLRIEYEPKAERSAPEPRREVSRTVNDGASAIRQPSDDIHPPIVDPKRYSIVGGEWSVAGDELLQTDAGVHWPFLTFGDESWTDYDFSVDLMRLQGIQACFLVVRSTDRDNNLEFGVSSYTNKRCTIYSVEGGKLRDILGHDYSIDARKWYTARVQVRGSRVDCFLLDDNKEVVSVATINGGHPHGNVGLRTWFSTYRFRNIKVTAPDGKLLWAGPPAIEPPKIAFRPNLAPTDKAARGIADERLVSFDGRTGITVAGSEAFDMTNRDYTIFARIKTRRGGTIISRAAKDGRWVSDGKTLFVRNGRLGFDIGWVGCVETRRPVNDDAWHDVAMTYTHQDHRVTLFIDGKQQEQRTLAPKKSTRDHIVRIGYTAHDFPDPTHFDGRISALRFYQRALNIQQIAVLAMKEPNDDDAVARWTLDPLPAATISDETRHGHEGTLDAKIAAQPPQTAEKPPSLDRLISAGDLLQTGTVWIGTRRFVKTGNEQACELKITMRGKTEFGGELTLINPQDENPRFTVVLTGNVNGAALTFKNEKRLQLQQDFSGVLRGKEMRLTFNGTARNGGQVQGDAILRMKETKPAGAPSVPKGPMQETARVPIRPWSNFLAFSPDSKRVAIDHGWNIKLVELETGKLISDIAPGRPRIGNFNSVMSADIASDGRIIASHEDQMIRVWDQTGAQKVRDLGDGALGAQFTDLNYSRQGKWVVGRSPTEMRLWDLETGKQIRQYPSPSPVKSLDLHPNGRRIVSVHEDNVIRIWDALTGEPFAEFPDDTKKIGRVVFSRDGNQLLCLPQGAADFLVVSPENGQMIQAFAGAAANVLSAAFFPSGRRIASVHANDMFCVWGIATGELLHFMPLDKEVRSLGISPDGKYVVVILKGEAVLYRVRD
jgi:serine/threonine protein kinase